MGGLRPAEGKKSTLKAFRETKGALLPLPPGPCSLSAHNPEGIFMRLDIICTDGRGDQNVNGDEFLRLSCGTFLEWAVGPIAADIVPAGAHVSPLS